MTATQMYESFLLKINESYLLSIFSWEVSAWLNQAQVELFRDIQYNYKRKPSLGGSPIHQYQDSLFSAEALHPFSVTLGAPGTPALFTNENGFLPAPVDFDSITSLMAYRDDCDEDLPPTVTVTPIRDVELASRLSNPFTSPVWGDNRRYVPYAPGHTFETVSGIPGWQIWPRAQKYRIELRYLRLPASIAIKNPPRESAAYSGRATYVAVDEDKNSAFPVRLHDEIVSRAVRLYLASVPDIAAAGAQAAAIERGLS